MPENTMMRFREDKSLQERVRAAIVPMQPQNARQAQPWDLFLRMAAQQLDGKEFDAMSLVVALATFASAGILPNKYNHHGYLIPYRDGKRKRTIVTPVFGYQGLIHLAYQARSQNGARLLDVSTGLIHKDDEYEDGSHERMVQTHRVRAQQRMKGGRDAGVILAYARFKYAIPVGGHVHEFERIQTATIDEIDAVDSGANVWATNWRRMAEKTPVRRACQSGRVELNYAAGMALQVEGAAAGGDIGDYMRRAHEMATEHGAPEAFTDIIEVEAAGMDWERYTRETAAIVERMERDDTTREQMQRLSDQLTEKARSMGAPDGWNARGGDERTDRAWSALEDSERQA